MWRVLLVAAIAACNQLYGLDGTTSTKPTDTDDDGIVDAVDNCPAVKNADQFDSDADGRGDRCDDCPLIANGDRDDFDHDGIGDACDPHPKDTKDCLLLVDSFADPALFAPSWTTSGITTTTTVTPNPGYVAIVPDSSATVTLTANAFSQDVADVIVRGTRQVGDPTLVMAMTAYSSQSSGYGCELGLLTIGTVPPSVTPGRLIPGSPVTDGFVMRLIVDPRDAVSNDVLCRVEYGVAIATSGAFGAMRRTGAAGVTVTGGPNVDAQTTITIDAISLTAPLASCPPTIYR
jgi:hypothetical protein